MNEAINERLVILAARNGTIQFVERAHAAIRRLEAAYARNTSITEGEYEGRRDALNYAIREVEDPMHSATAIEAALVTLINRVETLDAWLATKAADSTKVITKRVVDDRRFDAN